MSSWLTYSTLGGAVLVAAAAGILLGESAIDQINPLYYQGAAVHPRERGAALDETALAPAAARFADHYGWEEGRAARSADCDGCDALGARDAFAGRGQFAVIETGWHSEARPVASHHAAPAPAPALMTDQEAPAAEPSELERYAAFQVEEKPAATEPVEVAAAPAAEQ